MHAAVNFVVFSSPHSKSWGGIRRTIKQPKLAVEFRYRAGPVCRMPRSLRSGEPPIPERGATLIRNGLDEAGSSGVGRYTIDS